ncbi:NUDIX domain-containing protein [Bradyrhizobium roseum]|uniref:NUDIX domain-containing protein n=1 Tax=Bradyrhizobium roseum TaxID=3056648 RepID=UPI0026296521|nr:NUDIX hydrolase [Bradyrhizobium roseus]WKA29762.1 NUDIX hydrolase [Bradyrhizobium roseus]
MVQLSLYLPSGSAINSGSERISPVHRLSQNRPEVALAVVVRSDEGCKSVLMVRRANSAENCPRWVFPGGKVDAGESVRAAAKRELKEETGIEVARPDILGSRIHPVSGMRIHYVSFHYRKGFARLCEPSKLDQLSWVSVSEVAGFAGDTLFAPVESFLQDSASSAQAELL